MRPPLSGALRRGLPILLLLPLLAGCESTGLRRVSFTLRAGGVARAAGETGPLSFTTAAGWDVRLEEARVAVGPFYFNVAAPSGTSARAPASPPGPAPSPLAPPPDPWPASPRAPAPLDRLRRAFAGLLLPAARADAGQDQAAAGRVIGQVTRRVIVDALQPADLEVGAGDGVSERALSAALWILPQDRGGGGELPRASVAYVLGEARRGADLVRFGAYLPLDAAMASGQTLSELRTAGPIPVGPPSVPGAAAPGLDLDDGLVITLRVDPRRWLDLADFSDLAPYAAEPDGRKLAQPTDSVMRSLRDGVRLRQGVYSFL